LILIVTANNPSTHQHWCVAMVACALVFETNRPATFIKVIILTQFNEFGLSNVILRAISAIGYEQPTPIQRDAIPLILEGHDIMGLAQTGTGKTAAFGLPLVHHLLKDDKRPQPKSVAALIVAPTRELAKQIGENLREYTARTPLRVNMVVGGASIHFQKNKLAKGTDILVATPGRLMDLVERKAVHLDSARYLVLDEADQMLDLGFIHVLRKIAKLVGKPRQTLLFSATMPKQIAELSKAFLENPVRIEVARSGKAVDKVTQSVHFVGQGDKGDLLRKCLSERPDDLSLVFSRTKHGAEKLMKRLVASGFSANSIHGNKSQGQRERAIRGFKSGETRILVATDVAARGIDIPGISHVYNFDLPEVPENYVHRIGRTARAGREGEAVAFCAPSEVHLLANVEKLMSIDIDVASGERPEGPIAKSRSGRGSSRGGNGQGRANGRRHANGQGSGRNRNHGENRGDRNERNHQSRIDAHVEELVVGLPGRENTSEADGDTAGKNRRPGRGRRFGATPQSFGKGEAQPTGERSSSRNPKKADVKFRTRAGKKRGRKKPVAA
jgi:ATP-dependent RNA helicase RhlE